MTNSEDKYRSLISMQSLKGLGTEEALLRIGQLTDLSLDMGKTEGLERIIELSKELQKRKLAPAQLSTSHYFVGNAWASLRKLSRAGSDRSWDWQQQEIEKEIIHFRTALRNESVAKLPDNRVCQILTNLGNLMDHIGRFVEAIEYWNRALARLPSFSMAQGNRGYGLTHYAKVLYDKRHAMVFLKHAYSDLKTALSSQLHEDARLSLDKCRKLVESSVSSQFLDRRLNMDDSSLGTSKQEISYRTWCLENRLFLNPLNDLGPYPVAARDILTTPSIVVDLREGPLYPGYFNQMKQEFVSARYLYYDGLKAEPLHFSDSGVLLHNTLDYPSYALAVEKVKAAFRMAYSLLDKVAYFLNYYLSLSIPERNITFRTFWYKEQKRKKGLREDFQQRQNWPLRGLFWLSKDLFEDKPSFRECLEPDAQELHNIRNHLEHKYLKLHDELWSGSTSESDRVSKALTDDLAFSVYRHQFETKTLRLIKMVRAALIYLSLAIHTEEQRRSKGRDPNDIIPEMRLDVWEDEWKV